MNKVLQDVNLECFILSASLNFKKREEPKVEILSPNGDALNIKVPIEGDKNEFVSVRDCHTNNDRVESPIAAEEKDDNQEDDYIEPDEEEEETP